MAGWLHRGRRWLYLLHRWIGIVTCALLAMWVGSGVVMMYVPYPALTASERMAGLAVIDWGTVRVPPAILPATAPILEQGLAGAVWRVRSDDESLAFSAIDGRRLPGVDRAGAERIAAAFGRAAVGQAALVDRDQWTVAGGFDHDRPLWKVALDTPDGRILYISSATGAVVQDTRARERFWNWLGAVPHWLYPTILRRDQPVWRQVVLWTSAAGIVGVVSGMWIGVLRARVRRRYKGGRISPYRGWQWWHHVLGLIGGTLLTTWIVSGWLSVDPGRWFASAGLSDAAGAAYAGAAGGPAIDWRRVAALPQARDARRLRLVRVAGRTLLILEQDDASRAVIDAATLRPMYFAPAALARRAALLVPGHRIRSVAWLTRADNYWYEAKGTVELPVLRVVFDDPAATWVHISPATGELLGTLDARRRTYRWLYDGLHRWDFDGLITRRPLWDGWMLLWLLASAIVSVSAVVIGWRRLLPRRARHA